jgi:hypothetical protein
MEFYVKIYVRVLDERVLIPIYSKCPLPTCILFERQALLAPSKSISETVSLGVEGSALLRVIILWVLSIGTTRDNLV